MANHANFNAWLQKQANNQGLDDAKLEILDKPTFAVLGVYIVATFVGFCGNCVILAVIVGSRKFRMKSNYLIANLSIASIFYILLGAFGAIYRNLILTWPYSLRACQLYLSLIRLPLVILSFTIIAMSIDRNHVVIYPLRQRSSCVILTQILGIWISAAILMIPMGVTGSLEETISSYPENPSPAVNCIQVWTNLDAQFGYAVCLFLIVHLLPIFIMLQGMWRIRSKMKYLLESQSLFRSGSDRRVRLMRNSCIFFSIFIICWLPVGIFRFPIDLPKHLLPEKMVADLLYYNDVCLTMEYVIASIIPLVLFALSHDLREHLGNCSCGIGREPARILGNDAPALRNPPILFTRN